MLSMSASYRQRHRELTGCARELRHAGTLAEQFLWEYLRGRRLNGLKFRRQHPLGPFIADFYCDELRLVIEVDGAVHLETNQRERDQARDEAMSTYRFSVLRFTNDEVLQDTERVLQDISALAESSR